VGFATVGRDTAVVLLRREQASDVPTIDQIHRRAFGDLGIHDGPPVEDRLVRALRADPGWVPALSIVAVADGGAGIGHVVATEGRLADVPAIGIGPLAVLPEHQGRGVGAALMHAVITAADALGYPLAALLGDPGYYSRFAFVPANSLNVDAPDATWGHHFQARTLGSYGGGRMALC
jgi:putative acetyltransferase